MYGYVIVQVRVNEEKAYDKYRAAVGETIAAFEGEFLVRAGQTEVLEGTWQLDRTIVLRFPSMAKARQWYNSDQYKPLLDLRKSAAEANLILAEGI